MKILSQVFFWCGIVAIPLSWFAWYYAPEMGPDVISQVTDPFLRPVLENAHRERWGVYVGHWAPTLLILSFILERRADRKKEG